MSEEAPAVPLHLAETGGRQATAEGSYKRRLLPQSTYSSQPRLEKRRIRKRPLTQGSMGTFFKV